MSSTDAMRLRLASELNRALTDSFGNSGETFATVLNREINAAQKHYESTRFRFNEIRRSEFKTTAAGVRQYSLPADFVFMDQLRVKYGSSFLPITKIGVDELDEMDTLISATANSGIPSKYAVYGNTLQLYPAPGGAYTLVASYIRRFLPTSVTGSYTAVIPLSGSYSLTVTTTASHNNRINGWTTDGEALIRHRAKASIRINYLKDPAAMQEAAALAMGRQAFLSVQEQQAFQALNDQTFDALATGRVRAWKI